MEFSLPEQLIKSLASGDRTQFLAPLSSGSWRTEAESSNPLITYRRYPYYNMKDISKILGTLCQEPKADIKDIFYFDHIT